MKNPAQILFGKGCVAGLLDDMGYYVYEKDGYLVAFDEDDEVTLLVYVVSRLKGSNETCFSRIKLNAVDKLCIKADNMTEDVTPCIAFVNSIGNRKLTNVMITPVDVITKNAKRGGVFSFGTKSDTIYYDYNNENMLPNGIITNVTFYY